MRQWTLEERKKQSQLIVTWRPWESSKGPKTKEGKLNSKMNAVKHGRSNAESRKQLKLFALCGKTIRKILKDV